MPNNPELIPTSFKNPRIKETVQFTLYDCIDALTALQFIDISDGAAAGSGLEKGVSRDYQLLVSVINHALIHAVEVEHPRQLCQGW